jgi:hypothetical protein
MRTQSRDTHPEVERVQIELLRKAGVARRFSLARSLSQTVIQLSLRAIRETHPDASEGELALIFVELNYGKELAKRLQADFARRRQSACQTS